MTKKCDTCDREIPFGDFCSEPCAMRFLIAAEKEPDHRMEPHRVTEVVKGYKITWERQGDQLRVIDIEPSKETA